MSIDQETFENAASYSWLTPAGDREGEFSSISDADSWPLVDEYWVLIAFDENGDEL